MATSISTNSAQAAKVYSVGLFTAVQCAKGFMNLLSGPMPSDGNFASKTKGQTAAEMPIVKCGDLSKEAGDKVSVDLFNPLQGKPVMGDRKMAGKLMSLSSSSQEILLNQMRGGADSGGKMSQKRTKNNLRMICSKQLQAWMQRTEDQITLMHLAGARGTQTGADWVLPLATDPDLADIAVNKVSAPTKNRMYYANDATSPADIGTNDALTLQDVDRFMAAMLESSTPMSPIMIEDDEAAWNDPLYVMFVTARQWLYLKSRTSNTQWADAVKMAFERKSASGKSKHPLFDAVKSIMWNGLLIRPLNRYAIRFASGSSVVVDSGGSDGGTYTETTATTSVDVDRAIIVGGQALGKVYGRAGADYFYDWTEEIVDHGNSMEAVVKAMGGTAKIRFKMGKFDTDYGVAAIDSYAPDPQSQAGRQLLNS